MTHEPLKYIYSTYTHRDCSCQCHTCSSGKSQWGHSRSAASAPKRVCRLSNCSDHIVPSITAMRLPLPDWYQYWLSHNILEYTTMLQFNVHGLFSGKPMIYIYKWPRILDELKLPAAAEVSPLRTRPPFPSPHWWCFRGNAGAAAPARWYTSHRPLGWWY